MRTGIPFTSASANLYPKVLSLLSSDTVIPEEINFCFNVLANFSVASSFVASIIATWIGAILGGNTNPASSLCTMIKAPIIRLDAPHDVW